ncbi:MAG: CCA tRNA nucleotidyltransferase [Cyanobacteria bacterium J06560_2]
MPSPFRPETWPFELSQLPASAHLVGGSVRDQLINRQSSYLDLDFVLPERAVQSASELAKAYKAGFVVLDAEREIARVVFDQVTVDFAQQQGGSLEADLRRRDFTINAIAYHPLSQTFVDPLGGKADIAAKILRMVSRANLAADPLRILRGHRQAAQLNFTIEPQTQNTIHQLAPQLKQVSIERVRSELDALLSEPAGTEQLAAILEHGLLSFCLPNFTAERLAQIEAIDRATAQLQRAMPSYAQRLHQWNKPIPPGCYRSWIKASKLSCLVSEQEKAAQKELMNLSYSRAEMQVILCLIRAQPAIDTLKVRSLTRSEQFFLFKLAAEQFPAVSLLALSQGIALETLQPIIAKFLDPANPIAHAPTLITGNDIMQQLSIKPGPKLGKLLKAVEQAQANGELNTTEDAIAWLKNADRKA